MAQMSSRIAAPAPERAGAVTALIHPYPQIATQSVHAATAPPVNRPHMLTAGAQALGTRIASAFSFGVGHLVGWGYLKRTISALGVNCAL
jgi:hypothetical protein